MKITEVEVGTKVLVTDGSFAVRVDAFEKFTSIGMCKNVFEVVKKNFNYDAIKCYTCPVHNIVIKNTVTGKMYLHSVNFVKKYVKVKPAKITTLQQLEKIFGCPIIVEA